MAKMKEVGKKQEVNWFKRHWIWTTVIIIFIILFIFFIIDVANDDNNDLNSTSLTERIPQVEQIPEIMSFLEKYPDAEINDLPIDTSANNQKLDLMEKDCRGEMNESPDHYISITKDEQEIKIYLDKNEDNVLCWSSSGIDNINQTIIPPTKNTTNQNTSLSTLSPTGIKTADEKQNGYSLQDCYTICDGYATSTQRDLCKHSKSTYSCDLYGKPGTVLDNFVNGVKATIANQNQGSAGGTYTVQQCYDACEAYATSVQRDLCKHSTSTSSCDLYGKPGTALDTFVNGVKQATASQQGTGTYTVQQCYDACEAYATSVQRDLCKHSTSDGSCDLYGKPGTALDTFVNGVKQATASQQGTGTYTVQQCYDACDGYATSVQRDLCKHSTSDGSCDLYGKPGTALDTFVNGVKATIVQQNQGSTGGTYTVQDCYNECQNYATSTSRDLCMHSLSTHSCDLYGVPGPSLDNFVNSLKQYFILQNQPVPQNNNPQCNVSNTSGGDFGVPLGC